MDKFAEWAGGQVDGDLMLLHRQGMAYQIDQNNLVAYDETYFNKCAGYDGQEIGEKINAARIDLVARHFGNGCVVDIGIGSGEFIRKRPHTYGVDINEKAKSWLEQNNLWANRLSSFRAFTLWDVIEHIPDISQYFAKISDGSYLFTSVPIFDDVFSIRQSKHYRPGEHLYYWTQQGFIAWMALHRFGLIEMNDAETLAGRESIKSFAFVREPG